FHVTGVQACALPIFLLDEPEHIRSCLQSLGEVDLILSTGGVSVGEADFLGQVLREEGELTFWKLAIKPGKPLTCGRYRSVAVIRSEERRVGNRGRTE